jgi:hypothetical protein
VRNPRLAAGEELYLTALPATEGATAPLAPDTGASATSARSPNSPCLNLIPFVSHCYPH